MDIATVNQKQTDYFPVSNSKARESTKTGQFSK